MLIFGLNLPIYLLLFIIIVRVEFTSTHEIQSQRSVKAWRGNWYSLHQIILSVQKDIKEEMKKNEWCNHDLHAKKLIISGILRIAYRNKYSI